MAPRQQPPPNRTDAVVDGVLAGLAGGSALTIVTYLDMVIRARQPSGTPDETVRRLTDAGHIPLGPEGRAANRRTALGALLGYASGVATATAFGLLARRRTVPLPVATVLLGAAAMVVANAPMTLLRVSDPRRWSCTDLLSDIVPHLAYGLTAAATWRRITDARSRS
jgi:hypothetical protein